MKIYFRKITKRVPINKFGKLGFKPYMQIVKTDNIDEFNFRKKIKFKEMSIEASKYDYINVNEVVEYECEW